MSIAGGTFDYMQLYAEYDCRQRRMATLSTMFYHRDGAPAGGADNRSVDWMFVTPESQGDTALAFICSEPKRWGVIGNPLKGLTLSQAIDAIYDGDWPAEKSDVPAAASQ